MHATRVTSQVSCIRGTRMRPLNIDRQLSTVEMHQVHPVQNPYDVRWLKHFPSLSGPSSALFFAGQAGDLATSRRRPICTYLEALWSAGERDSQETRDLVMIGCPRSLRVSYLLHWMAYRVNTSIVKFLPERFLLLPCRDGHDLAEIHQHEMPTVIASEVVIADHSRMRVEGVHSALSEPLPAISRRLGQPAPVLRSHFAESCFVVQEGGKQDVRRGRHCHVKTGNRPELNVPFIRKDVCSRARSKRGLCCEMTQPTRRPFAPKLTGQMIRYADTHSLLKL